MQGRGTGFFLTARNQQSDVLRQNTVLEPPSNDFRTSNVAPDNQVFRDPDTENNSSTGTSSSSFLGSEAADSGRNSIFAPVPTEVQLGNSLDRLQEFENAPPQGGSTLTVSGNDVTVTNSEGESLSFNSENTGRLIRTEDDRLLLRNDSEQRSIELESGVDVTTEGDGELTVFGEDNAVTVQAGNSFETNQTVNDLTVRNPNTASTLQFDDQASLTVTGTRSDETDSLTVSGSGGAFLEFTQGDSGSIQRNEDGTITVQNETADETVTVDPEEGVSIGGEAEGTLVNEDTGGELTLEGDREFTVATDDDGLVSVRDETSAESTAIAPQEEPPRPSRPVQLQFFENLENRRFQQLGQRLLGPSGENEDGASLENRTENEDDSLAAEDEEDATIIGSGDDEPTPLATESPFGRSDGSKFGVLGDNERSESFRTNGFTSFDASESNSGFFDQSTLQSEFDVFGRAEESTFSTTV